MVVLLFLNILVVCELILILMFVVDVDFDLLELVGILVDDVVMLLFWK